MNELNSENAETLAQQLLTVADQIGSAINNIEDMAKLGAQQIKDEPEAYETAVLQGMEVARSLKILAMRFDRAALVKFA